MVAQVVMIVMRPFSVDSKLIRADLVCGLPTTGLNTIYRLHGYKLYSPTDPDYSQPAVGSASSLRSGFSTVVPLLHPSTGFVVIVRL